MFLVSTQHTDTAPPKRVNVWSNQQRLKRLAEQEARIAAERKERMAAERIAEARALAQTECRVRLRPGNKPLAIDLLRAGAARLGFSVEAITGLRRDKAVIAARHALIREIDAARPDLSSTQIAKLFDRDHTTILYVLGRAGRNKARKP